MKTKYHINIIILFEIIIPFTPILWAIFTQSNPGFGPTLITIISLHVLGRIIGRSIPASCDSCTEKIKPRGTSTIYYNCQKCGFKYSKILNFNRNIHND
jgi:tRNA(Ile2) C34 agmatinyltransferase TiaS